MSLNRVEFANFLCHFGKNQVMLDYLNEIVLPVFTDDSLVRHRGQENVSEYLFYDVRLYNLGHDGSNAIVGVSGQFIKNLTLMRTQVFDHSSGLVQDPRSMPSSPSSTFLLILNSHHLVFLPRTFQAPTLGEFESTVRNFISIKYKKYIDSVYEDRKSTNRKITKIALRAKTPHPEIYVVPLANLESVEDFVARFDKLRSIDFRLLRPNPAIDASDTFGSVRSILENLGANSGKIVASNASDGLDKVSAVAVIEKAVRGGNQDVTLKGDDANGAVLSGSNEDFKISVPLDSVPQSRHGLVRKLFRVFRDILPQFTASNESPDRQAKINNLVRGI